MTELAEAPPASPPAPPPAIATAGEDDRRDATWWALAALRKYEELGESGLPIVDRYRLERDLHERLEVLRTYFVPGGTPPVNPSIVISVVRASVTH
jgi:hypothetical protein